MRIHHINLGTMCPFVPRAWIGDPDDEGGGRLVCHGLLIEAGDGFVLVETGFGTGDLATPGRLGPGFAAVARPTFDPAETAIAHVRRLGGSARDVRHILVTHLDLDHAGGLGDFPEAAVHVYRAELSAAQARASFQEKNRYRPAHFAHGPRWEAYDVEGEPWHGFDCVRNLRGLPPEILLVPLIGHTRGHCAIAVDAGARWLVHAGDAYFFREEMAPEAPRCPPGLALFQRTMGMDRFEMSHNKERLRLAVRDADGTLDVFSAHDPIELARAQARV